MLRIRFRLTLTTILLGIALHCSLSAYSQSRIVVLDSIALPEEYILDIDPEGSGYVGLATVRPEGALCGGQTAWIELDSAGQITRFIPFIRSNGKGISANQYFRVGDDIYTFHPNSPMNLLHWDTEIRHIGNIPIEFAMKNERYDLQMKDPIVLKSENGHTRLICVSERYHKKRKEIETKGPNDWTAQSFAILDVSPDGKQVSAELKGRFPSYYTESFSNYRHFTSLCLDGDGNIVQSFGMGGPSYVYNSNGQLIDSLMGERIAFPADEQFKPTQKIEVIHHLNLEEAHWPLRYDAVNDRFLQHWVKPADKSLCDNLLAANDHMGLMALNSQRQVFLEVFQRDGFRKLATIPFSFKSPVLTRIKGDEIWVKSGNSIYHCRIELQSQGL